AHRLEDDLGAARRGQATLSPEVVDRLYGALDAIRKLVNEAVTGEAAGGGGDHGLAQRRGEAAPGPPAPARGPGPAGGGRGAGVGGWGGGGRGWGGSGRGRRCPRRGRTNARGRGPAGAGGGDPGCPTGPRSTGGRCGRGRCRRASREDVSGGDGGRRTEDGG